MLGLFGWDEDSTTPEKFAAAHELSKAIRLFIEAHTDKKKRKGRRSR